MKKLQTHILATATLAAASCFNATTSFASSDTEHTRWQWAGWGGGGYFWSAVFDPANADTIYLGGDVVGMYKSTDSGKSWKFINNGLHEYGVYSMAISKSNPKVLYAMTPNGMARTGDGGESWTPLRNTFKSAMNLSTHRPGSVRAIAVDPRDANIVYAGSGEGKVAKSADGGKNWTELDYTAGTQSGGAASAIAPREGDGFLWMAYKSANGVWDKHGRLELYLNNGKDWSAFNKMTASFYVPKGAPNLTASIVLQTGSGWKWQESKGVAGKPGEWADIAFDLTGVSDMNAVQMVHFVVRANGNAFDGELGVDAVTLHGANGKQHVVGAWNKNDGMNGWRVSTKGDAPFTKTARASSGAAPRVKAPIGGIAVAESDPNTVYIANRKLGVFKSADGGKTWRVPESLPTGASNVSVFPKDARIVYAAMGADKIWKSEDAGATWKSVSEGLPAKAEIREVVVHPTNPRIVHAIGRDGWNGFYFRSEDGGASWKSFRKFAHNYADNPTLPASGANGDLSAAANIAVSPVNPAKIFIAANWNNIFSGDGGTTWEARVKGADITCFHDFRILDDTLYAVAMDEGLFTSRDNGKSWKQLAPLKWQEGLSGHQWRVHAHKNADGSHHIVSTVSPWRGAKEFPNRVLVSRDSGKTFANAAGLPDYLPKKNTMWGEGYARALAADPKNPLTMYLSIDGDAEAGKHDGGGIFKTTDGGLNWTKLPNQPGSRRTFYGLVVDPGDSNRIYQGSCGDNGGVWTSPDAGATWTRTSLTDAWIFNLEIAGDGTLYAGGGNLWQSADKGKTWKQLTKFSGGNVVGIALDPANPNRIWISRATWGGGYDGGIFRSDDGGKTWIDITGDSPYRKPLVLRYNPKTQELWAVGVGAFRTKQDPATTQAARKAGEQMQAAKAAAAALVVRGSSLGADEPFKVEPLMHGKKAAFMLMFDDSCMTHIANAIPELRARNLVGTFYTIPKHGHYQAKKSFWESDVTKIPQVILGNHSYSHAGYKDAADMDDEIARANALITAAKPGPTPRLISYAEPGGVKHNVTKEEKAAVLKKNHMIERPPFGTHGAGIGYKNAAQVLTDVDKTLAKGTFGTDYIVFHGVGGDWLSFGMKDYLALLDGLEARRDDLWITDDISLHKYRRVAESAPRTRQGGAAHARTLELASAVKDPLYATPLTLSVRVPGAKTVRITQNGKTLTAPVDNGIVTFEALPNAGAITIAKTN